MNFGRRPTTRTRHAHGRPSLRDARPIHVVSDSTRRGLTADAEVPPDIRHRTLAPEGARSCRAGRERHRAGVWWRWAPTGVKPRIRGLAPDLDRASRPSTSADPHDWRDQRPASESTVNQFLWPVGRSVSYRIERCWSSTMIDYFETNPRVTLDTMRAETPRRLVDRALTMISPDR